MSTFSLYWFRICIAILSTFMMVSMSICYGLIAQYYGQNFHLFWRDWATITTSISIFIAYILSISGKQILDNFIGGYFALFASTLIFYISLEEVAAEVSFANSHSDYQAFECPSSYDLYTSKSLCSPCWTSTFITIITGFLVIVDLFWTRRARSFESRRSFVKRYGDKKVSLIYPDQSQGSTTECCRQDSC